MNKKTYIDIIKAYNSEKNLKRLIYRLIKYEYQENTLEKNKWLSESQICKRTIHILYTPTEISKERQRIEFQKIQVLNYNAQLLRDKGFHDVEVLEDFCIRYLNKGSNIHSYHNFPKELTEIDNSYFIDLKDRINSIIEYLSYIQYIKGYKIKNMSSSHNKSINSGTTIRYKSLK